MNKGFKVLLVDDEANFISTLAERLELRGISTQTANDGSMALALISSSPPDLMVLDIMMPGIGGLDILKEVRAMGLNTPVILLTGRGSTRDGIQGMRLGATDYLIKPVDIDDLIQKMQESLGLEQT